MENRELSGYELSMMHRDLEGVYSNFIVAAKYKTPLSNAILSSFLSDLCSKWSQMVLQVYNKDTLKPLKSISYNQAIENLSSRKYESDEVAVTAILREFNNLQFDLGVESPLWKVLIYKNIVFFICNHVLFDGTTGKVFHQLYADFLDSNSTIKCESDLIFDLKYHPNFKIDKSPIELITNMLPPNDWKPPPTIANAIPEFDLKLMDQPIYNHHSTNYQIPNNDTIKIIQAARKHGVKLTAVLYGLMTSSLSSTGLLKNGGDKLTTLIPINLRPFVNDKSKEYPFALLFGKWVPAVDIETIPKSFKYQGFWDYCQTFQSGLNKAIPQSFYPIGYAENSFLEDKRVPMIGMKKLASLEKNLNPTHCFAMSNIGALTSSKCERAWFDQPMVDSAFACHVIGSPQVLTLNFMAHRGIPDNDYQLYVNSSIECIKSFIKSL